MDTIDWEKVGDILEFLKESNAIEGVYDADSLFQAFYAWSYLIQQEKLTVDVILKTHKILMLHQKLKPDEKGYFRTQQVWVGNREGLKWEKILLAIDSWLKDVETSIEIPGKNGKHIQLDHIEFEKIHPFIDGNGRVGRILYNWQRIKCNLPIDIIKEKEKDKYYQWF